MRKVVVFLPSAKQAGDLGFDGSAALSKTASISQTFIWSKTGISQRSQS